MYDHLGHTIGEKFTEFSQRYEHLLERGTGIGIFARSNAQNAYNGLRICKESGIIDSKKPFFDAGGGDGLIVATALDIGIDAYAAEYHPELVMNANKNLECLGFEEARTGSRIVQGDFTSDTTYGKLGIPFEEIGTFYNFRNNQEKIAKKIANESPKGTVFILYGGTSYDEFPGLQLEAKIDGPVLNGVRQTNIITPSEHIDDYIVPETCMLIFRK